MKISILTLFPEMFKGPFDYSIIKKAIDKKIVNINFVNIRGFGVGTHKIVDDKPYGGGKGMILKVDVLDRAISKTKDLKVKNPAGRGQTVVLLTPEGITFNQSIAQRLSKLKHLILVCGHYEGLDKRVHKFVDEKISIGDFIVTGGEIPAMLITDAVTRLIKGVLKKGVTNKESFSLPAGRQDPLIEYPQYTKPRRYKNLHVPKILLTGHHKKIDDWQNKQSIKNTLKARPDLLKIKRKG
jgi:tRNA (guanine37-N1)-methyltransferase